MKLEELMKPYFDKKEAFDKKYIVEIKLDYSDVRLREKSVIANISD